MIYCHDLLKINSARLPQVWNYHTLPHSHRLMEWKFPTNHCRFWLEQILAVAARQLENAQLFAKKFNIPKAYSSYEQLAQDDEIGERAWL